MPGIPPVRHNASLDGLRALAVGAVLLFHAGFPGASLGWLGVDLFFALSGFLVTTLLAVEHGRTSRIALGKFWARRFLRLGPAYWLYVGGITAYLVLWAPPFTAAGGWSFRTYVASLWLYFNNYVPQGGLWGHQHVFGAHLWSLAVEEQFYLVWPLACLLLLRTRQPWLWALGAALVTLWLRSQAESEFWIARMLYTRGDGIMFGCAGALLLHQHGERPWTRHLRSYAARLGVCIGTVALLAAATVARSWGAEYFQIQLYCQPWFILLFVALIMMLWHQPSGRLAHALSHPVLVYVGKISYGVYLYHMVAHFLTWDAVDALFDGELPLPRYPMFGLRMLVFVGLSIGIAATSYRFLEEPFLRLKARFR